MKTQIALCLIVMMLMAGLILAGCGGEKSPKQTEKSIVGAWRGEITGYSVDIGFRSNGTGFMNTSSWAGGESRTFNWEIVGDQINLKGKDIGGYREDADNWKYEWLGGNLILHIQGPIVFSRIPETIRE